LIWRNKRTRVHMWFVIK